jgi:hypothetical protein
VIPSNITREHIIEAIKEIRRSGVPYHRESVNWSLLHNGEQFPPKYVISLANKFANDRELDPHQFKGGYEANNFLKDRGFEIVQKDSQAKESEVVTSQARDKFLDILANYLAAKSNEDLRSQVEDTFQSLATVLRNLSVVNSRENVRVSYSTGIGRMADVPWLLLSDLRETDMPSKEYIASICLSETCQVFT